MAAVPGDGNALNNMDGLVEFLVLRGKSIAKNLKLSDEGVPVATACASAPAVREFLAKCLHDVYSNKYTSGAARSGCCLTRKRTGRVALSLGASSQACSNHATPSSWGWSFPNA